MEYFMRYDTSRFIYSGRLSCVVVETGPDIWIVVPSHSQCPRAGVCL
jgi:hypothetical protein